MLKNGSQNSHEMSKNGLASLGCWDAAGSWLLSCALGGFQGKEQQYKTLHTRHRLKLFISIKSLNPHDKPIR